VSDDGIAPAAQRSRDWLSLGPASRQLGVDPDTLRRWADGGRVRSYATPGGHRRFARADLDRLQQSHRSRRRSLATLGATPDRVARAYARSYRVGGPTSVAGRMDGADREAFRAVGRRLVERMLAFLDAASSARKAAIEVEVLDDVTATARRLAGSGATVAVAVEAFIAARRPFLSELEALGRRRALTAPESTALYAEAASLFDRLLVHFVTAFQEAPTED
jgi:excisionase family DNA binding protein